MLTARMSPTWFQQNLLWTERQKVPAALIAAVEPYNKIQNTSSTLADSHSSDYANKVDMDEVAPANNFYVDD